MARFRAMLLGVADYDDPGIRALPFVNDDIVDVATALEARGYEVVLPSGGGRLGRTRIMMEVSNFLTSAQRGDTLMVYLSGHGVHADQTDYLVPSDADQGWPKLADVCVPLTAWGPSIERSPADGVLFLVDACREGFLENSKSVVARTGWAHDKIASAARRHVAWMFPCAPGQVARFCTPTTQVGEQIRAFSLFSRSIERSVADSSAPLTLAQFKSAVGAHMAEVTRESGLPPQEVRIAGEADHDTFIVLPQRPGGPAGDAEVWKAAASGHGAWRLTDGRLADGGLRDGVIELVGQLSGMRRAAASALASDPWQDPRFAMRMTERMEFLLGSVLGGLRISAAEAALLVALPFVYDVHWARLCARASVVDPADLRPRPDPGAERAEFEKFVQGHPRLLRRALSGGAAGVQTADEIGWWLLHRWVVRQQYALSMQAVAELLAGESQAGLFAEVLTADRLGELIRVLRADSGFIARTDRPQGLSAEAIVRAGSVDEQSVRERMVGYLLAVSHRLAIETTGLSHVIADHLGVADPVVPSSVRVTVESARWEPRGSSRVLRADCPHPAMEMALREHVAALDALLADLRGHDEPDLAVLASLPGRADADKVRAAERDGKAVYTEAGTRFRLDEDRVQELLMGRQLYVDSELAVREIYQNALDACRYRRARTEYLRRTGHRLPDWEGQIQFEQGIDDEGRPYLDCTDNGIGMGHRELHDVFAQAGARFAELPEYLEEQARWDTLDPPVRLYPNSQFGIGVLSYFMLADEITVDTCRLGQDGLPGMRLKVSIAGPGTLFRIQDLGPGTAAGTNVRLHLRPSGDESPVSCVNTLRNVLWVSEFSVEARDGTARAVWLPGELSLPGHWSSYTLFAVADMPVWWCDGEGAVLADGLRTYTESFGVIVNLTGEHRPQLSVSRTQILETAYNRRTLTRVLSQAVAAFANTEGPFLSFDWLCEFAASQPAVADLIFDAATNGGPRVLKINGQSVDIARMGFFVPDRDLIPESRRYRKPTYRWDSDQARLTFRGVEPLTDHITKWRLAAIRSGAGGREAAAGREADAPVRASPSDWVILRAEPRTRWDTKQLYGTLIGLAEDQPVPVRHVVAAAGRLDRPIEQVADRLAKLGLTVPRNLGEAGAAEPSDLTILHRNLSASWSSLLEEEFWLDEAEPVSAGHVIAAAAQVGQPVSQVAQRLTRLGFDVASELVAVGEVEPADRLLVSRYLDGTWPWLEQRNDDGSPLSVPRAHVIAAAAQIGRQAGHVARRLAGLGFQIHHEVSELGTPGLSDVALMSYHLDAKAPMLPGTLPVPPGHLLAAASKYGLPVADIASKLTILGFSVPEATSNGECPDLRILSWDLDAEPPWLRVGRPIPSHHVVLAAELAVLPTGEVGRILASLGLQVVGELLEAGASESADRIIISDELTGDPPWLDRWDEDDLPLPVPVGHVVAAADKTGQPIAIVARRLAVLGFQVPGGLLHITGDAEPDDCVILSRDLTGEPPWLVEQLVPLGHILTAAERLSQPREAIAHRLAALGFGVTALPARVMPDDCIMTSWELSPLEPEKAQERRYSDRSWWLQPDVAVPMWHIVAGAGKTFTTVQYVTEHLQSLGFQTPDILAIIEPPQFDATNGLDAASTPS